MKIFNAEFIGTFALIFIGAGAGATSGGGLVGVALSQEPHLTPPEHLAQLSLRAA